MEVLSQQGDALDLVCYRFYGHTNTVEAVLEINPTLSFLPAILPTGTVINLPDLKQEAAQLDTIQLWD